jgi:hypothetical protein
MIQETPIFNSSANETKRHLQMQLITLHHRKLFILVVIALHLTL